MHDEKLETKDSSQLEILTSQLQKIHEEAIGTFDDSIPAEEVSSQQRESWLEIHSEQTDQPPPFLLRTYKLPCQQGASVCIQTAISSSTGEQIVLGTAENLS